MSLSERIPLDDLIDTLPPDEIGTVVYIGWTTVARDENKIGRTFRGVDIRAYELRLGNRHFHPRCSMPGSQRLDYLLKERTRFISLDEREIVRETEDFTRYITRLVNIRRGRFYNYER